MNEVRVTWFDVYLGGFKSYRRFIGGKWYKHKYTIDALQLSPNFVGYFWARYGEINRYTIVIKEEQYLNP